MEDSAGLEQTVDIGWESVQMTVHEGADCTEMVPHSGDVR